MSVQMLGMMHPGTTPSKRTHLLLQCKENGKLIIKEAEAFAPLLLAGKGLQTLRQTHASTQLAMMLLTDQLNMP